MSDLLRESLSEALNELVRHPQEDDDDMRWSNVDRVVDKLVDVIDQAVRTGVEKRLRQILRRAAEYENRSNREEDLLQDLVDCTEVPDE